MTKRTEIDIDTLLAALEPGPVGVLPGSMPPTELRDDGAGDIVEALGQAAPDAAPPEDLFSRIEAEIDAPDIPGVETVPASAGAWLDGGNGIWHKLMASPPEGKRIYLLRCMPGGVIPAHTHRGWEYALVLEGRFQIAGRTISAGDAQYSAANSHHPELTTDIGCLLLVVA